MESQETKDLPQEEKVEEKPSPKRRKKNHAPEAKTATGLTATEPTGRGGGKYIQKEKIGTPKLGRNPNYVTKVGLGNLRTINAHGHTTD